MFEFLWIDQVFQLNQSRHVRGSHAVVAHDDDVYNVGQVACLQTRQDTSHHGIGACNRFADLGAVGAVAVTVAVDVGDVRCDELGPGRICFGAHVSGARGVEERHDAVDLASKHFGAVVLVNVSNLLMQDLGFRTGPHVHRRPYTLFLGRHPEGFAAPPVRLQAAVWVCVVELLL